MLGDVRVNDNIVSAKSRILAVEGDRTILRLIRVNLEADGLHVCEAATRGECLDLVRHEECDLLLLSESSSEGEALDVVSEVRDEEGWSLPVLLVTDDEPPKSLLRALAPAAFIRKPFDAARLAQCVRQLLSGAKCQQMPE